MKLRHEIQFDGHLKHQPEASVKYVVGHTDTHVVIFSVGLYDRCRSFWQDVQCPILLHDVQLESQG